MPTKAGTSTVNTAAAARASAHPYAGAQSSARMSRRTASLDEQKPDLLSSPVTVVSPTEITPGPSTSARTGGRKKASSVSHPSKSSRQQFSACHACRYRRVKCDLKDLSMDADPNIEVSCTNCRERGIRCKDEYAESKKQLRRGKRINQLELEDNILDNAEDIPRYQPPLKPRTTIPTLKPEFFDSPFYRRFHIQRPIVDPVEFRSRYVTWLQHYLSPESNASLSSSTPPLSVEGQLLAKILVVWAAAYGVDESGIENPENSYQEVSKRRLRVKSMIEEVIHLIDNLGLLRKPSWDGVRCLLMTLPLTEDVLDNPMDRLAMYEAAVQQVYTLCQHDGVATGLSADTRAANALVRMRIFWYAHVHEGLTTGLRGGRLLMDDDDLKAFNEELPPAHAFMRNSKAVQPSNMTYSLAFQYATAPIRLASACRKVHAALTGPKARAAKRLDGKKLEETWEALALCWEEFEGLRAIRRSDHVSSEDTTRFVDGWQIFLFECYNVIQEKIRDRLDSARAAQITELDENPDSPASVEALVHDLNRYLAIAEAKCFDVLDHVVELIRRHLGSSFFAYDASLVRDGCFFAGHTLALMPGRDEDVKVCLQALSEMRWAFSKGHERSQTIRLAWKSRTDTQKHQDQRSPETGQNQVQDGWTPPGGNYPPPKASPETSHHQSTSIYSSQAHHIHVASLPTHTASAVSQQSGRPLNAGPQRQYSMHSNNGASQSTIPGRLDTNVANLSYVDTGPAHGLAMNWSPVHMNGAPTGHIPQAASISNHSSSSDGSSPPELGAVPVPKYQNTTKSPSPYEQLQAPQQFPRDDSLPVSPTRVNPPRMYPQPPHVSPQQYQRGPVATSQRPQAHHQQYMPPFNGHAQTSSQLYGATANGATMQGHTLTPRLPAHGPSHTPYQSMPYVPNPHTLTPDEMSQFTAGTDYFPPQSDNYHAQRGPNGTSGATTDDSSTYFQYTDNGLYYVQR